MKAVLTALKRWLDSLFIRPARTPDLEDDFFEAHRRDTERQMCVDAAQGPDQTAAAFVDLHNESVPPSITPLTLNSNGMVDELTARRIVRAEQLQTEQAVATTATDSRRRLERNLTRPVPKDSLIAMHAVVARLLAAERQGLAPRGTLPGVVFHDREQKYSVGLNDGTYGTRSIRVTLSMARRILDPFAGYSTEAILANIQRALSTRMNDFIRWPPISNPESYYWNDHLPGFWREGNDPAVIVPVDLSKSTERRVKLVRRKRSDNA